MDSVILLSVLPFSDGLNLLKEIGLSVIFVLFVFERFTPVLSGVFKLTTSLESTVPERMSPISMSNKFDTSIKGSTSNQNVFSFYQYSKNLNITPTSVTFPTVLFLIPKKSKLVRDIINLLVPETAG